MSTGDKIENHRIEARRCVICGARVRNINPRTTTCDKICTKAKRTGLTREQQIWATEQQIWATL